MPVPPTSRCFFSVAKPSILRLRGSRAARDGTTCPSDRRCRPAAGRVAELNRTWPPARSSA